MKKLLSILIAAIMIVSAVIPVVTVGATDAMTLTVSSVKAVKGDKATVTVDVSNNAGIANIIITPIYDSAVLELTEVINGTVMGSAPTPGKNLVWTQATNAAADGTLVTLVFTVSENVEVGDELPVSVKVQELWNESRDYNHNSEVTVVAGTITIETPASDFLGAGLVLGEDISVKYFVDLHPAHAGATVKFYHHEGSDAREDGGVVEVEGVDNGDGRYAYTFNGVVPTCLGCNIKAELIYNGEVIATMEEYSVLEYCEWVILEADKSDFGGSRAKYNAAYDLVANLLYYGATAQIFANHRADELVNAGYEGEEFEYEELIATSFELLEDGDWYNGFEAYMIGAGVQFDYINSMYILFTTAEAEEGDMANEEFSILVTGDDEVEYTLDQCEKVTVTGKDGNPVDCYKLILDPTSVTNYDAVYEITLWGLNANGRRTEVKQTLFYSVSSYIYSMQNKSDNGALTPMAELARATYNYGLAAVAYVEA